MARNQPQINVRVPPELLKKLSAEMDKSGRSLTAEIVFRLEWSLDFDRQLAALNADCNAARDEAERLRLENEKLQEAMDVEDGVDEAASEGIPEGRRLILRLWRAQLRGETALKDLQRLLPGITSPAYERNLREPPVKTPATAAESRALTKAKPRSRKR